VADIGCGTGRHAVRWAVAGARVIAVDFSAAMLERARAKLGAQAYLSFSMTWPSPSRWRARF